MRSPLFYLWPPLKSLTRGPRALELLAEGPGAAEPRTKIKKKAGRVFFCQSHPNSEPLKETNAFRGAYAGAGEGEASQCICCGTRRLRRGVKWEEKNKKKSRVDDARGEIAELLSRRNVNAWSCEGWHKEPPGSGPTQRFPWPGMAMDTRQGATRARSVCTRVSGEYESSQSWGNSGAVCGCCPITAALSCD